MTAPTTTILSALMAQLAGGELRIVDLTQTLSPSFPSLQLPAQFGQVQSFSMERISQYDEAGPGWYWNNFTCGEHTGTHFDAPVHWISGRDHPNNSVDTIAVENFIAPAVVLDASAEVAGNEDWLLTVPLWKSGSNVMAKSRPGHGCFCVATGRYGPMMRLHFSICARTAPIRQAPRRKLSSG